VTLTRVKLTYEEYVSLPEDNRPCELLDGELFMPPTPTPKHQAIVGNLFVSLDHHVKEGGLGKVFVSPLDVVLDRDRPLVLQPDILFISTARLSIVGARIEGAPDLVVEVFSPGSATRDRTEKSVWYGQYRVREYWLVDPDARTIEVRRLSAEGYETLAVHKANDTLTSSEVLLGLRLPVAPIFA
jgi:Uma2 family endonuclease